MKYTLVFEMQLLLLYFTLFPGATSGYFIVEVLLQVKKERMETHIFFVLSFKVSYLRFDSVGRTDGRVVRAQSEVCLFIKCSYFSCCWNICCYFYLYTFLVSVGHQNLICMVQKQYNANKINQNNNNNQPTTTTTTAHKHHGNAHVQSPHVHWDSHIPIIVIVIIMWHKYSMNEVLY